MPQFIYMHYRWNVALNNNQKHMPQFIYMHYSWNVALNNNQPIKHTIKKNSLFKNLTNYKYKEWKNKTGKVEVLCKCRSNYHITGGVTTSK